MFDRYRSPDNETSLFKGIPMSEREHSFVKGLLAAGCSVKYRGKSKPGYRRPQSHCHRDMADSFTVYPPTQIWIHREPRHLSGRIWSWEKSKDYSSNFKG